MKVSHNCLCHGYLIQGNFFSKNFKKFEYLEGELCTLNKYPEFF